MIRIGIDGGGTKTRALVLDENLQILGEGTGPSSNPYAVGLERAVESILESADFALRQAGLRREIVAGWGLGLGGVTSRLESARLEAALGAILGGATQIVVAEDVVAAHRGAFPDPSSAAIQILCIAGTGANCFGRAPGGQTAKADGIGPLLGDRGSGYRIGEAALRLYGLEADGVAPETALSPAVLGHFGAQNLAELIQIAYAPDFERARVASLAPLVVQLAPNHEGARHILEDAGRELAQTARAVLRQLEGLETAIQDAPRAISNLVHELGRQPTMEEFADRLQVDRAAAESVLAHMTQTFSLEDGDSWPAPSEVALVGGVLSGSKVVRASFEAALGAGVKLVEARYESAIGAALLVG